MIINKGIIQVKQGVEYVSDWKDDNGSCVIEQYISQGRTIVNKQLTGTGFTSYCLSSSTNVILVSPRIRLIQNKISQFNENAERCFYFNREKDKKTDKPLKTIIQLENELTLYFNNCSMMGWPMKLMVTYDSFSKLCDMLEQKFCVDLNTAFLIAVDESHSLIKDIRLKQFCNKNVLSELVSKLFNYQHLLFISATPIIGYVQEIQEFKDNDVDYYELEWSNAAKVTTNVYGCRSALNAFDQIYNLYDKHYDSNGTHVFDAIYGSNGSVVFSYEAVIFLNSIQDIKKILGKYIGKLGLIDVNDVSVICADTKENARVLHSVNKKLNVLASIPKEGEEHKRWWFVSRTAFEGCDFYHTSSSTFVIANYNVDSLSLDIGSDIPQIAGRERSKANLFRNTINIFYTNNNRVISDDAFDAMQRDKMNESLKRISIWNTAQPDCKDTVLKDLADKIERQPNDLYVSTVNGRPEIDKMLLISEQYCRDILKNHQNWYVMQATKKPLYSMQTQELKNALFLVCSSTISHDRIHIIHDYFKNYPSLTEEFFMMLRDEGYNDLAQYFSALPLDRISACGYNTTLLSNEIAYRTMTDNISAVVVTKFTPGQTYTKKEVKSILQSVYDSLGLKMVAKATDLANYISCSEVKRGGQRVILIG